ATKRMHYNHVHVGFANGGVFDQGGLMQPGMTGINLTRKPEAVLDPAQTRAYQAHAEAAGKGDLDLSDSTTERIADALASRPGVLQIGGLQAGRLALAGDGADRAMGGRRWLVM